ncbi:MAG: NAD-dependent epimerase/dehydratase family protein [bacterium]
MVFGGSGFLGSHVADCLSDRNYDVHILDLVRSPYLRKDQKMVEGDILDPVRVCEVVRGADYVYNFAGLADMDSATTRPVDTVNLNIMGNLNILEACVRNHVSRYVFASTIYVYSQKGGFYRCSKQASELYIEEYNRRYGLGFTILRYGTLYGTRADERNSIYSYLKQALETGHLEVMANGEEVREYINVKDAARLSVDILSERYKNKHMIITGHHPMKYIDMLKMIKEILGTELTVEYNDDYSDHYNYTPYSFVPKIGHKLVSNEYLEMGNGLLEVMNEIYQKTRGVEKKEPEAIDNGGVRVVH